MPDQAKDVAFVSRVIEYLPATLGDGVIARDCVYGGLTYTKGGLCNQADGLYKCSGDQDGSWEKVPEKK
jgi:hypothetical protein